MSVSVSASQFTEIFTRFYASRPQDFFKAGPVFNDFDGPNVEETLGYLNFSQATYEPIITSGELHLLSKSALNGLISQIQNVNNSYTTLTSSRDQSSYINFANAMDAFVYHTRMFGVPHLAAGGAQIEAQRMAFSTELQSLIKSNSEVEVLKKDVRTLITPAIAGSLSEAFHQRRDNIFKGRIAWLIACIGAGVAATLATFDFVHTITAVATPVAAGGKASEVMLSPLNIWAIIAIRTIVLLPLFAAFGFTFTQYRKERDFEEEYAHKAAVANSLPNYGDLAREPAVRDQIVTAATTVIFSSPSEQARKAETSNAMAGGLKEVVDVMGKALSKK